MDYDDPCDYNWIDEFGGSDEFEKFWEDYKKKRAIREHKKIKKLHLQPEYHGKAFTPLQLAKIHRSLEPVQMTGRPERSTVIGADDILNLRISLEMSGDVEQFIERM